MFEYKENLSKEFLLSKVTEEDIFMKYLNIYPNLNDYFRNPLRTDAHPDCKFYRDSRGTLKFKDFAYGMNIDCFNCAFLSGKSTQLLRRVILQYDFMVSKHEKGGQFFIFLKSWHHILEIYYVVFFKISSKSINSSINFSFIIALFARTMFPIINILEVYCNYYYPPF